jgi:site-specific DNA recombinase
VLELAEFERKRKELEGRTDALLAQERQLEAAAGERRTELAGIAGSIEGLFCERVRAGLAEATFEQKRRLVELLVDRVIVTDEEIEIRVTSFPPRRTVLINLSAICVQTI